MQLLDKALTSEEKRRLDDSVQGCICRLFISDDAEEIVSCLGFAIDRLSMLAYSRVKELKERGV